MKRLNKLYYMLKCQLMILLIGGKIDKKQWIFSSTDNSFFNYNSKYLFLYVKKYMPDIHPYYVINNDELRRQLSEMYGKEYFIETKSLKGIRLVLKSGVWFTSAGLPVYGLGVGKKHSIINLWHGVPLKKIALMENQLGLSRYYFRWIFSNNYKYILTTSDELKGLMADSFGVCEDKIKVWGQPRNDYLFHEIDRTVCLKEIYGSLPEYEKLVLYAPTFREYGTTEIFPFSDFDLQELDEYLEKNKILIFLRMHISEENVNVLLSKRILCMNADVVDDVTEILNIFDMLITDYSSIYIDYLLLNRPIIFLPYDKEEYLQKRGLNFNYDEVTPGAKPESQKEFLSVFNWNHDNYAESRNKVNNLFNQIHEPCSEDICRSVCMLEEIHNEKGNNVRNI